MVNKHFSSESDDEDFDSIENIEVLDTEEQNTSDNMENSRDSSRRQGKYTNDDLTRSFEIHKRQNGNIRKPHKVPPAPPGSSTEPQESRHGPGSSKYKVDQLSDGHNYGGSDDEDYSEEDRTYRGDREDLESGSKTVSKSKDVHYPPSRRSCT